MGQQPPHRPTAGHSRRTVLAVGPACLAVAVTACAAPGTATPAPPAETRPTSAAKPAISATPAGESPVTSSAPRVLTTTDAVRVGGGKVVSGILVVQPVPGLYKAFDARCPHLAAIVSPPKDGVIRCPVHGSEFIDVDGSLLQGPAPRGLKEIAIEVEGDQILTG